MSVILYQNEPSDLNADIDHMEKSGFDAVVFPIARYFNFADEEEVSGGGGIRPCTLLTYTEWFKVIAKVNDRYLDLESQDNIRRQKNEQAFHKQMQMYETFL